ncbi:MAG: hypothetical protein WAS51_04360, partial [Ilumatobacteraceae bacterium]
MRLVEYDAAQRALGPQAIQRVWIGAGPAAFGDDADDARQRVDRRGVAVQQSERLAVMGTDS